MRLLKKFNTEKVFSVTGRMRTLTYYLAIMITICVGIFFRIYNLDSDPPPIYQDEFFWILDTGKWNFYPFFVQLKLFLFSPLSPLTKKFFMSGIFNPQFYYIWTRLPSSIYGIGLMILLIGISSKVIQDKKFRLLTIVTICTGVPVLIHLSRFNISIGSIFWFYLSVYMLYIMMENKKLAENFWFLLYIFLGFALLMYDIRLLFYSLAFVVVAIIIKNRLKLQKYLILMSIILYISVLFISHPGIIQTIGVVTGIDPEAKKVDWIEPQYYKDEIRFNIQNVLLYFHPDYLILTGGKKISSYTDNIRPYAVPLPTMTRFNLGFIGILGYWSIFTYIALLYFIYETIIIINKDEIDHKNYFFALFSFAMLVAYIISISFYRDDNPISSRHLLFYAWTPIMTINFIEKIFHKTDKYIFKKGLLYLVIILIFLTVTTFSYNYYNIYPNDDFVKVSFEEPLHTTMDKIISDIKMIIGEKGISNTTIFYLYNPPDRFIVIIPVIEKYILYHLLPYEIRNGTNDEIISEAYTGYDMNQINANTSYILIITEKALKETQIVKYNKLYSKNFNYNDEYRNYYKFFNVKKEWMFNGTYYIYLYQKR